jgi:hypothetical protein
MLFTVSPQTRQLIVDKIRIQLIIRCLIDTLTNVSSKCINVYTNHLSSNAYLTGDQILHDE